jgi:hypothetical protein
MKLSIFGHIFYCRLIKRDSQLKFLAGSHYFLRIKSTDPRGKGQPEQYIQAARLTLWTLSLHSLCICISWMQLSKELKKQIFALCFILSAKVPLISFVCLSKYPMGNENPYLSVCILSTTVINLTLVS